MKLIRILFILLIGVTVLAQTPLRSTAPDITIKKISWSKREAIPLTEPWPMLYQYFPTRDVFSVSRPGYERLSPPPARRPGRGFYIYSAKITNGAKAIKAVAWDYVFNDCDIGKELGRYSFFSVNRIGRNQSSTLTAMFGRPPEKAVGVKGQAKSKCAPTTELVELKCVLYADDSMWCQPGVPPGTPDWLRIAPKFKTR